MTTAQLRELGYSRRGIYLQGRATRLLRRYRGVYAVGHPRISLRGRWMAAVLACGPGAVLSHRAAAALHDLRGAPWTPIDVTAPTRHDIKGIRCHFVRTLDPADFTIIDAIPVTTVSRLLLDHAEILAPQRLRTLIEAAQRATVFDRRELDAVIERNPGRHGLRPLAAAIATIHDEAPWTQSDLERRFLELIRDTDLPQPQTNVLVAGELVDCFWPDQRLVVELDGYKFHRSSDAFEADRVRDARLLVAGYRVVRFTYRRVVGAPRAVVEELRQLLRPPVAERAPALRPVRSGE